MNNKPDNIIKGYWNTNNISMYGVIPPYPSVVDYSKVPVQYSGMETPFASGMPQPISLEYNSNSTKDQLFYSSSVIPTEVPTDRFTLYRINSREPYASEFMPTKYGNLETRLGTSLGTK